MNNRIFTIYCYDKTEEIFYSIMNKLNNNLDENEFIPIHRSYIVNITKIRFIIVK
ncbi:LytTR family transcriptional regulator DNA-binding domain-containing protein [Clostridium perfringens]|nr:LytTR family transcriptional regulator DNA-binding domain-containing protein [Clostridium perfringens]